MYVHPSYTRTFYNETTGDRMSVSDTGIVIILSPRLTPGRQTFVITCEDMNDPGLNKINADDPNYGLLRALVEWGGGYSRPYVETIDVDGETIKIVFVASVSFAILALMLSLLKETVPGKFVEVFH